MKRRRPFPFDEESAVVMQAFGREAGERLRKIRENYVCPENVQRFMHGTAWQSHSSYDPDGVSELQKHSHELHLKSEETILGRLDTIECALSELVQSMHRSFLESMFGTVSKVCDSTGNVVSMGKEPAKAILEMLEKIEFGVDRDGKVSLPTIYDESGLMEAVERDPLSSDPDYLARVEQLKQRKSGEALAKERERRAKFVNRS